MSSLLTEDKNMAISADSIWLNRYFLHWWLLPSLHVHASWLPHLVADAELSLISTGSAIPESEHAALHGALHQHWSAQLLLQQGVNSAQLAAITAHPALPVCMASPALFDRWLLHAGMLMASPQLRRCIDRSSRIQIRQTLGDQALEWAVRTAPRLHTGLASMTQLQWHGMELGASVRWLGAQLLAVAMDDAPTALHERLQWQLPMQWKSLETPDAHWPTPVDACAISLQLMNTLDSAWLSSLPKTR